jgi:hypothetical protein
LFSIAFNIRAIATTSSQRLHGKLKEDYDGFPGSAKSPFFSLPWRSPRASIFKLNPVKSYLYKLLTFASRIIGMKVRDHETGEVLGKVLCIPFGGKIHWFGYTGTQFVFPAFEPRDGRNYSHHQIVFKVHPVPDFPDERRHP